VSGVCLAGIALAVILARMRQRALAGGKKTGDRPPISKSENVA